MYLDVHMLCQRRCFGKKVCLKKNTSTLIAPEMAESEKRERAKSRLLLCRLSDVLSSVVFKVPTQKLWVGNPKHNSSKGQSIAQQGVVLRKCYAEVLSQGVRSRCVQDDSTAHWITLARLLCTCAEWGRAAREWMTWGSCECENTSCESLPCHVRAWHASQCSMPPTIVHAPHIKASHSSTCSSFPFSAYTLAIMTGAESSVKVTKPC